MTLFESGDPRPIHFMGIAGAGMSGLALLARHQGAAVTGCDKDPQGAADLAVLGVEIWRGHDPRHVCGARAVVVTAAVPREHPELEQAGALGIPVVRRADALGQAVANGTVVGVAGTHGKTTTTAMVTEALAAAGRNPTGLAGGRVAPWGGNARLGGRELFVVEADEFDRAFLALPISVAVVNNVEADHLECYGTVQALEDAFVQFAGRARRVIAGADDAGAGRVAARVSGPVWRVGLARDADVRIADPELDDAGSRARVVLPDERELRLALGVPGLHNLRNAGAALAVACELGADVEACIAALAGFAGVARRFERLGEARGVTVVDDYAHHPTEVRATLAAARQAFPRRRVVAVFQPHLYSRTALHGEALGRELAAADVVVVAPVYAAREQPIPGVTADLVARGAALAGATTVAVRERTALTERVARTVRAGDVVFTLGRGTSRRWGPSCSASWGMGKWERERGADGASGALAGRRAARGRRGRGARGVVGRAAAAVSCTVLPGAAGRARGAQEPAARRRDRGAAAAARGERVHRHAAARGPGEGAHGRRGRAGGPPAAGRAAGDRAGGSAGGTGAGPARQSRRGGWRRPDAPVRSHARGARPARRRAGDRAAQGRSRGSESRVTRDRRLVAGLDLGSTKTCAVIAEVVGDLPRLPLAKVLGVGLAKNSGVRRGMVRDIDETKRSVVTALRDAERMAGVVVKDVTCGIAGEHVSARTSTGVVALTGEEVAPSDVGRVNEVARAVSLGRDNELLHDIPQEYVVDQQRGIVDPVGMTGTRLEGEMYLCTGQSTAAQNLRKAVQRAGYRVADLVLEPLAAS